VLALGRSLVAGRTQGHYVDGVADVALDVVAGAVGVADLLPAHPADEQSELGLYLNQLLAAAAVVLLGIAGDLLLDLADWALHIAAYYSYYMGGMKGCRGCTATPLPVRCTTDPFKCDGLSYPHLTCDRLFCWERCPSAN